nr:hypothetical protein [uncultured Desulfobacter sp.]
MIAADPSIFKQAFNPAGYVKLHIKIQKGLSEFSEKPLFLSGVPKATLRLPQFPHNSYCQTQFLHFSDIWNRWYPTSKTD